MANSAYLFNSNALQQPEHQVAHGFSVGHQVYWTGAVWALAQADDISTAQGVVMVSELNGADDFWVSQDGMISGITTQVFVSGTFYYLSTTTPGLLQSAVPVSPDLTVGLFMATGTDKGFYFGGGSSADSGGGGSNDAFAMAYLFGRN